MARTVSLVCFDLGGVLVRICRSWEEGCAAAGVDVRDGFRHPEHEPRRRRAVEDLQRGAIDGPTFWGVVSECFGGVYSPDEVARVHSAWLLGEYERVGGVIDSLHDRGVETACLSNTNAPHWESLVGYRSLRRLQKRFASHEMGLTKPDAAIFRQFEQAVGRAADEILFFEDTPENAEAARARGWRAEVVDHRQETAPQITRFLLAHGVF